MCVVLRRKESECNEYLIILATQHPFSPSPDNSIPFAFILLSDAVKLSIRVPARKWLRGIGLRVSVCPNMGQSDSFLWEFENFPETNSCYAEFSDEALERRLHW